MGATRILIVTHEKYIMVVTPLLDKFRPNHLQEMLFDEFSTVHAFVTGAVSCNKDWHSYAHRGSEFAVEPDAAVHLLKFSRELYLAEQCKGCASSGDDGGKWLCVSCRSKRGYSVAGAQVTRFPVA